MPVNMNGPNRLHTAPTCQNDGPENVVLSFRHRAATGPSATHGGSRQPGRPTRRVDLDFDDR